MVAVSACLHELFEQQAARTPDAVALVYERQRLTYRELARRSGVLAHRLRALRAGADDAPIGLLVERSLETVVGILGILKAGAAYLPIDPALPHGSVAFLCADAGVRLVLTQTSLLPALPAAPLQAVCLDTFDWDGPPEPLQDAVRCRPEDLAYVIYTSGSTGRPKGVCVEHRNIVNYVLGVAQRLQLEPGMSYATVSTIAADLGNTVLFPALVTGGCLHVISRERAEDQALLAEYFARERIDVLKIVPSHLAALQAGRNPAGVLPRRRLILGGESSRHDWIEQLRAMAPDCEIYNHYGPTETTVGVLTYHAGPRTARHAVGHAAARPGAAELPRPYPGCGWEARGRRRARRDLHRRQRRRARLPEPPGTDRREVHRRSVQPGLRATGCIAPATWGAARRTATSSSSAAAMTRSSCTATASSSARSRARCASRAACAMPWCWRARMRRARSA